MSLQLSILRLYDDVVADKKDTACGFGVVGQDRERNM